MSIWQKIDPWIDREKYAFTTFTIIIGCLTLFTTLTKDSIRSSNDLIEVEGKLLDYSFKHGSRGTKMYYLWLERYPCTFQIPADYLPCFKKTLFINGNFRNQIVQLKLSKKQSEKLFSIRKNVFINDIYVNGERLLTESCTVNIERRNFPFSIAFSLLFLFAGGAFYFFKSRRKKNYFNDNTSNTAKNKNEEKMF
jgi:hypothetical protein